VELSLKYYRSPALIGAIVVVAGAVGILNDILKSVSVVSAVIPSVSAVTIVSALLLLYDRWLWRSIPLLLSVKDVSGRYVGELTSDFGSTNQNRPITIEIRQTASFVHVLQFTQDTSGRETRSESLSEDLTERTGGCMRLSFAYHNEGDYAQSEKREHRGYCVMDFDVACRTVSGQYFTNRDPATKGGFRARFQTKTLKGRP
jgi:hypothetical protein